MAIWLNVSIIGMTSSELSGLWHPVLKAGQPRAPHVHAQGGEEQNLGDEDLFSFCFFCCVFSIFRHKTGGHCILYSHEYFNPNLNSKIKPNNRSKKQYSKQSLDEDKIKGPFLVN